MSPQLWRGLLAALASVLLASTLLGNSTEVQAPGAEAPAPLPERWDPRAAMTRLTELSTAGDHQAAQAKAAELLGFVAMQQQWSSGADWRAAFEGALPEDTAAETRAAFDEVLGGYESTFALLEDDAWRAELHYAVGVALLRAADALDVDVGTEADSAFRVAAANAGPGALRLDALYDAGLVHLLEGERRRAEIPELGGTPPAPATPAVPAQGAEEPPDPLELARAAYLRAREALTVRLRADWRDPDTRANLELIQRRLKELDEIEREREEEQQDEPPEEPQENPDEPNEDEQEQQDEGEQDQEDGQDQEGEQDQQDGQDQQPPEDQQEGQQPPESEDESGDETDEQQGQPPPPQATSEEHLTREEIQRLLDKLEEIEQRAEDVREQVVRKNRVPVEKDW